MPAFFRAKDGSVSALMARVGPHLLDLLRANGIPQNSVLTRKNGELVSEHSAEFGEGDRIEITHIRPYDLNVTRAPQTRLFPVESPIYTKAITFERDGDLEIVAEQFNQWTFPRWVEDTFVESVLLRGLIRDGDRLAVGLSGGRDSVAFMVLLEKTRHRLPPFEVLPVTVTGLPDWEEPATFSAAQSAAAGFGSTHMLVNDEEIQRWFRLNSPLAEVLDSLLTTTTGADVMMVTHHVMRRSIEIVAESKGVNRIVLGLNADDLLATLVSWFLHGYPMGPIPERQIGPFTYLFPLYRITKKELTLYLECVRPDLNTQGPPGRFTRGPGERSMAYALSDHLLSLMPGIDYYVMDAFSRIGQHLTLPAHRKCDNCGAAFLDLTEGKDLDARCCDVCRLFSEHRAL